MASVTFTDGPAKDWTAKGVARLPVFLRVVYDRRRDAWDVLDQLDDEWQPGEEVHVYVRRQWGHARGHGRFCSYAHVEVSEQLRLDECRENGRWAAFVDRLARDPAVELPAYKPNHALLG